MKPATSEAPFARVLVVVDDIPKAGRWGRERRIVQLVLDLRALSPEAKIVLLTKSPVHAAPRWAEAAGVEVVGGPAEGAGWLAQCRFFFSAVFLTGQVTSKLLMDELQATQPQAIVAALLSTAAPWRLRLATRFPPGEERRGAALAEGIAFAQVNAALALVDEVLVRDDDEALRAERFLGGAKRVPYPSAARSHALGRPGFETRHGILSWGHFASEAGDPDEHALWNVLEVVAPTVARLEATVGVTACLENAPGGWAAHSVDSHQLAAALRAASVLIIARPFGVQAHAQSLLDEAVDAGTPVVAMRGATGCSSAVVEAADLPDLARHAARIAMDRTRWTAARALLDARWITAHDRGALAPLARLLGRAGIVAPVPPTRPEVAHEPTTPAAGPRTIQGQIQSDGFSEHRPISIAFTRADLSADQLWPHLVYETWYDAHALSRRPAEVASSLSSPSEEPTLVSIVMPVFNTDSEVLRTTIESVFAQTYPFWELCAVDDASTSVDTVSALESLATRDSRVKVQRLETNEGIVGASNAALEMASGAFVALLDHDDLLSPDALAEVVRLLNEEPDVDYLYTDEDKIDLDGRRTTPFLKPSWSPYLHLGVNYVTHFSVYRRTLLEQIGGFRTGFDGSQDYDLSLRATEAARRIAHLAKPVYSWRMVPGSAAITHDAKPYAIDAARRALNEALARRGTGGHVEPGLVPGTWRPRFPIKGDPLVSILIPTRNGRTLLERCITTLLEKTTYQNVEFIVIDNGSDDPETLDYLRRLDARVVRYPYRFNYARQMNLAVDSADGEYVVFLNDDMELITPEWLEAMIELGQQPEVGAVGARLLFPTGRPQHEGVFVGFGGGSAGNVDFGGYFGLGRMIRDATAVTAACMLMRQEPFRRVGGFEERLRVAFNDVDLCLRLRECGYRVLYTPYAEFFHAESASRGKLHPGEDEEFFVRRWGPPNRLRDPFYNPNLDSIRPFRLKR